MRKLLGEASKCAFRTELSLLFADGKRKDGIFHGLDGKFFALVNEIGPRKSRMSLKARNHDPTTD